MTIICLGYFDKFSRFFLDIKSQLKAKSKTTVTFKIYSNYFSGFLYTILRFQHSSWLPLKAWFKVLRKKSDYTNIINTSDTYKGIEYSKYIQFHLGLNKGISKKSLQLQALAYIDIFDTLFIKNKPKCLLSFGDSRLLFEIAIAVAKEKNIKVYYLEQGPFNTTFFDDEGVNANLSIRKNENKPLRFKPEENTQTSSKKYLRLPLYRGLDFLFALLFERTKLYPPDLKHTDLNSYKKKPKQNTVTLNTDIPTYLLICQVPTDVNTVSHSPNYKSHTEILKDIHQNLPLNTHLIVREHPLFIDKYEDSFYTYAKKYNICINNISSLNTALNYSQTVIVNNSTVGIEAVSRYKTTVVLGDAFYDNDAVCLKVKEKDQLRLVLKQAKEHKPNIKAIDDFITLLKHTVLVHGKITDKQLTASKTIANHLLQSN